MTAPLLRGAVGGDRRARRTCRRRSGEARRAPHAGRRTDVRVDRRHGRRRVEHRGARQRKSANSARRCCTVCRARFAKGGFVHDGQGKWYPGEVLPRWAVGVYWRVDGEPLWRDDALIADTRTKGRTDDRCGTRFHVAPGGTARAAANAGVDRVSRMCPGCSRTRSRCRRTSIRSRPTCRSSRRARAARAAVAGGTRRARRVRPAAQGGARSRAERRAATLWESSPWPLRRERLYAVAGDSPLGLRLPLSSLPDVLPAELEVEHPVDPFAPREAIPTDAARSSARRARVRGSKPREVVKTALAVQVRNGHLYVFMPPLQRIEDYAALLAAIEDTARAVGVPVAIEGYTPPRDPRVRVLNVTPDPGVIEVNIHPAVVVARVDGDDVDAVRGSAADAPRYREIHARRPPHRHRRRQPRHARRRDARRQPAAAPPRPAAQPGDVLAEPSVAVVPVFRHIHRTDQPGARAWTKRATTACTSWRSRSSSCRASTARARPRRRRG